MKTLKKIYFSALLSCILCVLIACGGENDGAPCKDRMHNYTPENKCSSCGQKWNYTENLSYTLSDDQSYYMITGIGTSSATELVTPYGYKGVPVKGIAENAFKDGKLTSVTLTDNITSIGTAAFAGTPVYSKESNSANGAVYFGKHLIAANIALESDYSVKDGTLCIADGAFSMQTKLTNIILPDTVTHIGRNAFSGCSKLESVFITDLASFCNIKFLGNTSNPLHNGANLYIDNKQVTDLIIPDTVTEISDYTFKGCLGITSVTIGNSVTRIGLSAFESCLDLTSVTVSDSVTDIASYAFGFCKKITDIQLGDNLSYISALAFRDTAYYTDKTNWENGVLYIDGYLIKAESSVTGSYTVKNETLSIADKAFNDCSELTSVSLPDGIKSIGSYAFQASKITEINIPSSVKIIGDFAFYGCTELIGIAIPESVTYIGKRAFDSCSKFTSVTIPSSVTFIGDSIFKNCADLETINVINTNEAYKSVDGNLYSKDGKIFIQYAPGKSATSFTVPSGVTTIAQMAFNNCTRLTSIDLPSSVTDIETYAFSNCTGMTSFTIPGGINEIKMGTFESCSGLTGITIPDNIRTIGQLAFYKCTSLTSVTFGSNVVEISTNAFSYCSKLTSISFPDSVTDIGDYAFRGCTELKTVTFGTNLTNIGQYAFDNCDKISNINYRGSQSQWEAISKEKEYIDSFYSMFITFTYGYTGK